MNKGAAVDDDSGVNKKKREKKGFKVDRYERYQRTRLKKISGKEARSSSTTGKRIKTLTFDETARSGYLLTMHKRKNERRVKAFVDAKQKIKRDSSRTRRAQREEARQAYNRFAAVPILPNFTYQLPRGDGDDVESENDHDGVEGGSLNGVCGAQHYLLPVSEKTIHAIPTSMLGGGCEVPEANHNSRLDDEFVTVEVKPLFGKSGAVGADGVVVSAIPKLPANDFSDLPAVVEQELLRLKKETKGPARTKPRLRMIKELAKIQKIKKHSRKGHGKKRAKGKKKNRR